MQRAQPARVRMQAPRPRVQPCRAIEIDFSDPDTQISLAGMVLGLVAGLGAPFWYINRAEKDEERLEELRALNRATFAETGEYMSEVSDVKAQSAQRERSTRPSTATQAMRATSGGARVCDGSTGPAAF